jgi:serine/threonine protein kinase
MMAGVCDGVHHLHELNLVHCDLKPRNILIAENAGTAVAKVVDFGLARHMQGGSSPKRTAGGTLQYMSPEQLEARSGDPERSWDVYSLGVTLYELLVGECPIDPSFEAAEALEFEKAARLRDRIKQLKELPEMSQSRHR